MVTLKKIPVKEDPSDILQQFPNFNVQLLCCRHWKLSKWEFEELSFPFWRIYYNANNGAYINYNNKELALLPDRIYLIAPNTSYSSHLFENKIPEKGYALEGTRVQTKLEHLLPVEGRIVYHLFIHFNLGVPYDNIGAGIFQFYLNSHLKEKISIILEQLSVDFTQFDYHSAIVIQSLINDLLSTIPKADWNIAFKDQRVQEVARFIENNLQHNLKNDILGRQANMATNAFTRLFVNEMGISPQRFVKKKRIDKACVLLHHTSYTIDRIASETGFADRYHFSRVFNQVTGFSPARYRKGFAWK